MQNASRAIYSVSMGGVFYGESPIVNESSKPKPNECPVYSPLTNFLAPGENITAQSLLVAATATTWIYKSHISCIIIRSNIVTSVRPPLFALPFFLPFVFPVVLFFLPPIILPLVPCLAPTNLTVLTHRVTIRPRTLLAFRFPHLPVIQPIPHGRLVGIASISQRGTYI